MKSEAINYHLDRPALNGEPKTHFRHLCARLARARACACNWRAATVSCKLLAACWPAPVCAPFWPAE